MKDGEREREKQKEREEKRSQELIRTKDKMLNSLHFIENVTWELYYEKNWIRPLLRMWRKMCPTLLCACMNVFIFFHSVRFDRQSYNKITGTLQKLKKKKSFKQNFFTTFCPALWINSFRHSCKMSIKPQNWDLSHSVWQVNGTGLHWRRKKKYKAFKQFSSSINTPINLDDIFLVILFSPRVLLFLFFFDWIISLCALKRPTNEPFPLNSQNNNNNKNQMKTQLKIKWKMLSFRR